MEILGFGAILALAWYNILVIGAIIFIFFLCAFNEVVEGSLVLLAAFIGVFVYFGLIDVSTISFSTVLYYAVAYLAIGCVWSLFKYKNKAEEIALLYKGYNDNPNRNNYTNAEIVENIKDGIRNSQISFWIIFFPISMVKFALSDFVDYLISKLGRVYDYIARSVVNSILPNASLKDK